MNLDCKVPFIISVNRYELDKINQCYEAPRAYSAFVRRGELRRSGRSQYLKIKDTAERNPSEALPRRTEEDKYKDEL